jgi:hypothetical protein
MKLGLIIPYRNREAHLKKFIPFITKFLKNKNIDFKIVVVNQDNQSNFNKSKLMNIGADYIFNDIDYFCFHDVDLIPMTNVDYSLNDFNTIFHNVGTLADNKDNHINENKLINNINEINLNSIIFDHNYKDIDILGGVIILDKNIWNENPWNEIFSGWGYEDNEYFHRLKAKHYQIKKNNFRYISLHHHVLNDNSNNIISTIYYEFINFFKLQTNKVICHYLKNQYTENKFNNQYLKIRDNNYKINNVIKEKDYTLISVDFPERNLSIYIILRLIIYSFSVFYLFFY